MSTSTGTKPKRTKRARSGVTLHKRSGKLRPLLQRASHDGKFTRRQIRAAVKAVEEETA
jgi:hypothetical protein